MTFLINTLERRRQVLVSDRKECRSIAKIRMDRMKNKTDSFTFFKIPLNTNIVYNMLLVFIIAADLQIGNRRPVMF